MPLGEAFFASFCVWKSSENWAQKSKYPKKKLPGCNQCNHSKTCPAFFKKVALILPRAGEVAQYGLSTKTLQGILIRRTALIRTFMPSLPICSKSWQKWAKANDFTKPTSRVSGRRCHSLSASPNSSLKKSNTSLILVFEVKLWSTKISKIILRL